MVSVIFCPATGGWQRKSFFGVFLKKLRAVNWFLIVLFSWLGLLAIAGAIPAVWALFQEPMEVNIVVCTAGMILTIVSLAAIGVLAIRCASSLPPLK